MELIGTVARLQVQRSRLKPGAATTRVYDPSPLREVDALDITPRGVLGVTPDGPVLDVHHADHPDTRNVKLVNGLSLLPAAHYALMRELYGEHLVDGIAGESLLLETPGLLTEEDLAGTLLLETETGTLELGSARVAAPCVEFSRFAIRREAGDVGPEVLAAMAQLGDGVRGFYVTARGTGRVTRGARLLRP